jgi:uncharacterized membrane protein YdbT with pleckstrin-like domain
MSEKFMIRPSEIGFFLRHYLWAGALSIILIPAGLIVLNETQALEWALGIWTVAAIIISTALIHTYLNRRTAYIALSGEELVYEFGILSHNRIVAPINKITDVALEASWFERIIGVCTLKANTAGGSGYEIIAQDFAKKDVDKIYSELLHLIRKTPGSLPDELAKK